jgi:hypothetical protein
VLKVANVHNQQVTVPVEQNASLQAARAAIASALKMDPHKLMIMAGGKLIKPDEAGNKELRTALPAHLRREIEVRLQVQEAT